MEDNEEISTQDLLTMTCEDDGLSEAQLEANRKVEEAYKKVNALLDSFNQTHKVVGTGKHVYGLVPKEASPVSILSPPAPSLPPNVTTASKQVLLSVPVLPDVSRIAQEYPQSQATMSGPPLVVQNTPAPAKSAVPASNTYKLVMDRRLGLIVGTVPTPQGLPATPITQGTTTVTQPNLAPGNIPTSIVMQTPAIVMNTDQGSKAEVIQRVVRPPGNLIRVFSPGSQIPVMGTGTPTIKVLQDSSLSNRLPYTQVVSSQYAAPRAAVPSVHGSLPANPVPVFHQPTSTSEGNSSSEENRSLTGDPSSQKLNSRLFPSLMVSVKPTLQSKEYTASVCSKMRSELDKELKKVLQLPPNELTEWLIQQGLIRAEQKCHTHLDSNYQPIPFQLGIYSDSSKFPNSGGYVWVSECCGQRHLSVFAGSIFEGVPHTPKTILKLIYHWACQTSTTNIAQWVHVTMNYIKTFHTAMRAVCIASVHEKLKGLGGDKKDVEVAIMTLGTSSNDGRLKQVKVEILGVLDQEKNIVRLFAAEPPQKILGAATSAKRDYRQILRPLADWVDKRSVIVTDLSIDRNYLLELGFPLVKQSTARSDFVLRIVEYLSSSIPRSFQNVLPALNRPLIQQYLDEISWREAFGPSPLQAFKNFVIHLAEITKLELGQTLMACLNQISNDPFKNWSYCNLCKQNSEAIVLPNAPGVPAPIIPAPVAPTPGMEKILRVMVNEPSDSPKYKIDCLPESIKQVDQPPKKIRKRNLDIEECPQPSASPVAAKKPRTQTVLQEYYYGRIKGKSKEDLDREEVEWRANPANSSVVEFQCCVCQRMFTNNLLFMRHLMKHTQNKGNVDLTDETPVCKYCLRTFQSSPMLERHVKEDHIVKKGQLTCRICNIIFFSTLKLTEHMHNTHVELELPYSCKICGYRSSMHRDVVDHFHEFHDGSRKLQCPFCLQVVTLSGRGKHSLHNVFLFFQHIQKHFIQPRSIKCDKCILRFVTKSNIQEHAARDHLSCKGKPGLTRLQFKGESIIMPVPESPSQQSASPVLATKSLPVELPSIRLPQVNSGVNGKVKPRSKPSMLNNVGISPMMGLPQEEVKVRRVDFAVSPKCCECKGDIYQERHFLTNLVCSHCRYITCCSNAIKAHIAEFHSKEESSGPWKPSTDTKSKLLCKIRSKLLIPMYCICGFRNTSGDALAKHLAQSDCRTAYASLEDTKALENQSASFPPLVILDDEDQSNNLIKAYAERMAHPLVSSPSPGNSLPAKSIGEPQSMLNVLGLVRKPSTDESSNDIPDSDEKGELTMEAAKTTKFPSKAKRKRRR